MGQQRDFAFYSAPLATVEHIASCSDRYRFTFSTLKGAGHAKASAPCGFASQGLRLAISQELLLEL